MGEHGVRTVQLGFVSSPRLLQAVAVLVLIIPAVSCWSFAIEAGDAARHLVLSALVGVFVAVRSTWFGPEAKLNAQQRRQLLQAKLSATPSRDPQVDAIALAQLERAAAAPPWVAPAFGIAILLMLLVAPALAAARSSGWWLLVYAEVPLFALVTPAAAFFGTARERYDAFSRSAS